MHDFGIGTNASNYKSARLSFSGLGVKSVDLDITAKLRSSFMFTGKALRKLSMSHEEIIISDAESNKLDINLEATKSENEVVFSRLMNSDLYSDYEEDHNKKFSPGFNEERKENKLSESKARKWLQQNFQYHQRDWLESLREISTYHKAKKEIIQLERFNYNISEVKKPYYKI